MKCQILFSGKNKKNNIILSSAENAQRVVKVKKITITIFFGILEEVIVWRFKKAPFHLIELIFL